jgi:uncharacterized protein
MNIKNSVIIVTGASSGIGEATTLELGKRGAIVVLAARRTERLEAVAKQIPKSLVVTTDLMEETQIKRLVDITLKEYGRIDGLLNIAGAGTYKWFKDFSRQDIRDQFEINLLALIELTRLVVPIMVKQGSGHIINMCSYASRISVPPITIYSASKAAVEQFSEGIRRDLKPHGITVSAIYPSGVSDTEFNKKASTATAKYYTPAIFRVPRESVARIIADVLEHPRSRVFIGKWYEIPVYLNLWLPGLVDWGFNLWLTKLKPRATK